MTAVVVAETGEIVPTSLVMPVAGVSEIVRATRVFEDTCRAILRRTDWQEAGDGMFVVRSGWRRLSLAYGISDELLDRVVETAEDGAIVRVTTIMRAKAPNGRSSTGVGVCSLKEKCCDRTTCRNRKQWHSHCRADCDGRAHWTAPDHVLSATSFTRALSRAISDLVAGAPPGDDFADEDDDGWDGGHHAGIPESGIVEVPSTADTAPPPEMRGLDDLAETVEAVMVRVNALDVDDRNALGTWCASANIPIPPTNLAMVRQIVRWLEADQ